VDGVVPEALFRLEAVDAYLAANPQPAIDTRGSRRAWDNLAVVKALADDPGWRGEMVEGVRMATAVAGIVFTGHAQTHVGMATKGTQIGSEYSLRIETPTHWTDWH
jgi:hypothetical protein